MELGTIISSVVALIGTLCGTFGGILVSNKLTTYRIEQLEKKIECFREEHTDYERRISALETAKTLYDEKFRVMNHRIDDLEKLGNTR